ncbi:hypothetical protein QFC19_001555 [Naganishia cerealis]|uniref:Uncharacterized protein n=1 Tax=Naganishia cerealis TaxID=610337 RepID=A0ACC2WH01_9TREE|nr:hypothetical protein QFC19_001555 [Naganishia cerealis]
MSALARSQMDAETQTHIPPPSPTMQTALPSPPPPPPQDDHVHELIDFEAGLPVGDEDLQNGNGFRNREDGSRGRGEMIRNGSAEREEFPAPPLPPPQPTITTATTTTAGTAAEQTESTTGKLSPLPDESRITDRGEIPRLSSHQHTLSSAYDGASPSSAGVGRSLTSAEPRYDSLPSGTGNGVATLSLASAAPPPDAGEYQHDVEGTGMEDPAAAAMRYKDISLLPTRRQNVACDACRARKVKCVRMPMAEKVHPARTSSSSPLAVEKQLTSKGLCDRSIYVTQVTSSRKGRTGKEPSFGGGTTGLSLGTGMPVGPGGTSRGTSAVSGLTLADMNGLAGVDPIRAAGAGDSERIGEGERFRASKRARIGRDRDDVHSSPSGGATAGFDLSNLLLYMFSPTPVKHAYFGYTDRPYNVHEECWPLAPTFEGPPSKAHLKLMTESLRMDPLLDPNNFRRRFSNPSNPDGPPPAPIIACILAWGAKFSEHPLIVADRQASSADLPAGRKRSRLAQMMSCRAQEVLETHKVFRVPSLENLQAALMMVPLVGPGQYRFWHCVSVELCLALGYNNRTVVTKQIPAKERGPAGYAFWLTFWHDACAPALAREQPRMLRRQDDDHDLEVSQFYESNAHSNPIGGLIQQWHSSITALSRTCRVFARGLYLPKCERLGVPMSTIKLIVDSLQSWRTEFLAKVGVPTVWPESWDFVAAVTACSSDLTYHALWVVLAQTLDESGIYELRQIERGDAFGSTIELHQTRVDAEAIRQKINDEALHGVGVDGQQLPTSRSERTYGLYSGRREVPGENRT